jgi:hypothetical protein
MKNFLVLISCVLMQISMVFGTYAQEKDCEVTVEGLNTEYTGDCKRGLAHGEGTAKGEIGEYVGKFKKGSPTGLGKMSYVNGITYEGGWKSGLKHGEGVMMFPKDSVLKGFWKEDRYIGEYEFPYEIVSNYGSAKMRFKKVNDTGQSLQLDFLRQGKFNMGDVLDLSLQNDSGNQQTGMINGFFDVAFPFTGRVEAVVNNLTATMTYRITIDFIVYEPGDWRIVIDY